MSKKHLFFVLIMAIAGMQSAAQPSWLWARSACSLSFATNITSIATDTAGNIFIAGNFRDSARFGNTVYHPVGTSNLFIAKYDSIGSFLWMRSASGANVPPYDLVTAICTDPAGNCYITGFFNGMKLFDHDTMISQGPNPDVFIARLTPAGNVAWLHQGTGAGQDYAYGIGLDALGNCYVGGSFQQTCSFGNLQITANSGGTDMFIVKLDASGNLTAAHSFGGSAVEMLNAMDVDMDGNCYAAGVFSSPDFILGNDTLSNSSLSIDAFTARFDSGGNALWGRAGTGPGNQEPSDIAAGPDGNSFVTGIFKGDTMYIEADTLITYGYWDFFTVQYDSAGNFLHAGNQGSATFGAESSNTIVSDSSGNFYTAGLVRDPGNFAPLTITSTAAADVFVAKFNSTGDADWVMQSGSPSAVLTAAAICRDANNNLLVAGSYEATTTFGNDSLIALPGYTAGYYIAKLGTSNTTAIHAPAPGNNQVQLFPNPASGMLRISGIHGQVTARIFDLAGKLVMETGTTGAIDMQSIPPGLYLVEIIGGDLLTRHKIIRL